MRDTVAGRLCAGAALVALAGGATLTAQPPVRARYDSTANADLLIREALSRARADRKRVMLEFGADWCIDCRVLDTLFASGTMRRLLDEHFHVVKVDVGLYNLNMDIDDRYGRPTRGGIPAFVILSPAGEVITSTSTGAMAKAAALKPADVEPLLRLWATAPPGASLAGRWVTTSLEVNDVAVELSMERDSSGKTFMVGRFTPTKPGFRLYGTDLPPGGIQGLGRRTWMEIRAPEVWTSGRPSASPATTNMRYESLGLTVPVFPPGAVTLRLPITITQPRVQRIPVLVSYMACSESVCLPPVIDAQIMVTIPSLIR